MQTAAWLPALVAATLYFIAQTDGHCQGKLRHLNGGVPLLDASQCQTHVELGHAVGAAFRSTIAGRIQHSTVVQRSLAYVQTKHGAQALQDMQQLNERLYPQLFEEMRGIAAGAGLPFLQVLVLNMRSELGALADDAAARIDDCSDALLDLPGVTAVAHNEDMTEALPKSLSASLQDTINRTYIVHAAVGGIAWTAYTYAGELSTSAFGFNDRGIAFTLNAVFPAQPFSPGIARNMVSRSLLDASSFDQAVRLATAGQQTIGHSINLMSVTERRLANVKVGPGRRCDVLPVANGSLFHANSYQHLDVSQHEDPSSIARLARAAQLPVPNTTDSMLDLLGDRPPNASLPIYR